MAIVGPTGVGKSALAMRVAERSGCAILSVDSMQVYRGMDIGTAKPTTEERRRVPHHMIDVVGPESDYTVAEFQRDGRVALSSAEVRPLIVGGSGLHLRALIDPLEFPPSDPEVRADLEIVELDVLVEELVTADPGAAGAMDLQNRRRVERAVEVLRLTGGTPTQRAGTVSAQQVQRYEPLVPVRIIGVDRLDEAELTARLAARVDHMRNAGLLEELGELRPRLGRQASQAVGYKELIPVVDGQVEADTGFARVLTATRSLVKRQRTFFRRDPRIEWFDLGVEPERAESAIMEALEESTPA